MDKQNCDLFFANGEIVFPWGIEQTGIAIRAGKIVGFGSANDWQSENTVDCRGLTILPGVIDTQVHFREPGLTHKEDLASGTLGAIAGGVTGIFEMPNTNPLTVTPETLADKLARAKNRAWCDYSFFMGGTVDNAANLGEWERLPGCCGVKIFMGSSTGNLLSAEDEVIGAIFQHARRRIAVHAEDEALLKSRYDEFALGKDVAHHPIWRDVETALKATKRAIALAYKHNARLHILHITSAQEMAVLAQHKHQISVEVTPQHLTLSAPECYEKLGSLAQMNPPIRSAEHREALWEALKSGVVDVIGSDHAPHTLEEKAKPYPTSPSGMTGVQTLVPVMLNHVNAGRLSLQHFVELTAHGPARLFQIAGKGRIAKGYDADLTIVDLTTKREITNSWIKSKTGWTPYDGDQVTGWPIMTVLRGNIVMRDDEILGKPQGEMISFYDNDPQI